MTDYYIKKLQRLRVILSKIGLILVTLSTFTLQSHAVTLKDLYKPCENYQDPDITYKEAEKIVNERVMFLKSNPNHQAQGFKNFRFTNFYEFMQLQNQYDIERNKENNNGVLNFYEFLGFYYRYTKKYKYAYCSYIQAFKDKKSDNINYAFGITKFLEDKSLLDKEGFPSDINHYNIKFIKDNIQSSAHKKLLAGLYRSGYRNYLSVDKNMSIILYQQLLNQYLENNTNKKAKYLLVDLYQFDKQNAQKYKKIIQEKFTAECKKNRKLFNFYTKKSMTTEHDYKYLNVLNQMCFN